MFRCKGAGLDWANTGDNRAKWLARDRDLPPEHAAKDVTGHLLIAFKIYELYGEGSHVPEHKEHINKYLSPTTAVKDQPKPLSKAQALTQKRQAHLLQVAGGIEAQAARDAVAVSNANQLTAIADAERGKLDIAQWQVEVELYKDEIAKTERALKTVAERARDVPLFAMLANVTEDEFRKSLQQQYARDNAALLALNSKGPPPRPAARKPSLVLAQAAAAAPHPATVPSADSAAGGAQAGARVSSLSSHDREAAKPWWSAAEEDMYDCTCTGDDVMRTHKWMRAQLQEAKAGLAHLRSTTQGIDIDAEEDKYTSWFMHLDICMKTTASDAGSEVDDDDDENSEDSLPAVPPIRTKRARQPSPTINLEDDSDNSVEQEDAQKAGGGGAKKSDDASAALVPSAKRSRADLDLGYGDAGKLGPMPKGSRPKWPKCQAIVGVQHDDGVCRGRIIDRAVVKQKPTVSVYFHFDKQVIEDVDLSELTAPPDGGANFVQATVG